ncbi:TolC family outer membrane protein [uncultured Neptuniibacter sp.]|uniref:TolC family outer membrane protein n=1 Tax=uncultured Neptuniibacter sp. TaxID=502143 RepID=UPI00263045C1|nr:TolC family outer membrane protein [uncultured Neptuniibacter sp.]
MYRSVIAGVLLGAVSTVSYSASLEDVVAQGLSENPEVKQAINSRNAVYQEVRQAKAGYLPKVDLALGMGYEWTNNPTTRSGGNKSVSLTRSEASLSLRQMIFDGFGTRSEVDRQKARAMSADKRLIETAETYALEAARAYIELNRRDALLKQAKETLYNHVKIYDQIKRRSESGLGALASIQQAEGRLALAEVNVLAAENNMLDAKANYLRITGMAAPEDLTYPELINVKIPESLSEATEVALANHPTLSVAEADTQAAVAQYNAAKRTLQPRIDFEMDRTWNNDLDGVDGTNEDFTAMFRLRYNLYNGGADLARVRQTQHQIGEAQAIQGKVHREVLQSIELSWNAYSILSRQLPFLEQHVASSQETRNSYQKQFNIGQRSLLDLLDTENEVFSSKNDLTNAMHDQLISQYRVVNGMGTLLDTLNLGLPEPNLGDVQSETDEQASVENKEVKSS